jgi:hypothetical protein
MCPNDRSLQRRRQHECISCNALNGPNVIGPLLRVQTNTTCNYGSFEVDSHDESLATAERIMNALTDLIIRMSEFE